MTQSAQLTHVLRVLLGVSFCKGLTFQCTIIMLTFFLQQNDHLTEEASFNVYGLYGLTTVVVLILVARAIDRTPAFSLVIPATVASTVARVAVFLLQSRAWVSVMLMVSCMSIVDALGSAGLTLAMKRIIYAKDAGNKERQEEQLDFYMAVDYGLSNLGVAIGSFVFAGLRHLSGSGALGPTSLADANALLLLFSVGVHIVIVGLVLWCYRDAGTADQAMQNPQDEGGQCGKTWRTPSFWTYMLVCSLLIPVRTLFRHLDLTVPAFLTHVLGQAADFPYIQAINPLVTLVGVTFLAILRYHYPKNAIICGGSKYWAIVAGTLICALGFMVFGLLLWPSPTGHVINPMIGASVGIFIFSVGEVYWSSIFTSYALARAPEGQEAAYTALVALPSLAVKLPTSLLSNALIQHYCPAPPSLAATTPCDGLRLWLIVGAIALVTPVALTASAKWLNRKEPSKSVYVKI